MVNIGVVQIFTKSVVFMRFFAIVLLIFGAVGAAVWLTLQSFNHFGKVAHAFEGRCAPVTGVAGPEDMAVDPYMERVFISSLDRRDPGARGAIHIVDPADPLAARGWRDMTGGAPSDFQPLGLAYFEEAGVRRLFVVNAANNAVEIFHVAEDGALTHLDTKTERRMTSPNNVTAVGVDRFYVTNDARAGRDTILGKFQFLTRAGEGDLLYFNGVAWRMAATDLKFANGIAASRQGDEIYVAETAGKTIRFFARDGSSGGLRQSRLVKTPTAPDNITVSDDGVLWVAGLPKPLSLLRHAGNDARLSPSSVMRVDETGVSTVYLDDGAELSASSVAARVGDTLLIGAIYERKFLLCELPGGAF